MRQQRATGTKAKGEGWYVITVPKNGQKGT